MQNYKIIPISEEHLLGYNQAVDQVARERKYLAFLVGPSLEMSIEFVKENIAGNWPHVVAIVDNKIVVRAIELYKNLGFVIEGLHRNSIRIDGHYENYISMALLLNEI